MNEEVKDATPVKKEEEKPKKEAPKVPAEKASVCVKCGKKLKSKSWYYRDGKYYCNKRCWKESLREAKQKTK